MRDLDIRRVLAAQLDRTYRDDPATMVVNEFDLSGKARIDVAVINGRLAGYELKSARDTLRRLPNQVAAYSMVLDQVTLVVAHHHLGAARALVPNWWGLIVATENETGIALRELRQPSVNEHVNPAALVQLLWRDEALDELTTRGADTGLRSKPRRALWARLVECLDAQELNCVVRNRLRMREGWRAARQPPANDVA